MYDMLANPPCSVWRCSNKASSVIEARYKCDEHIQKYEGWNKIEEIFGKTEHHVETDDYNWISSHLNYDSYFINDMRWIKVAYYLFNKVIIRVMGQHIHVLYEFGNSGNNYICHDCFVYDNIDKKNKINEYTYVPIWRKIIRASNIYPNILPRDITGMIELFL